MRISDWSSDVCSSDLGFDARRPKLAAYVCLTEYDAKLPGAVAFAPDDLRDTLGELAAGAGLKQLRIPETEKDPYVPFFLSGGRQGVFDGAARLHLPNPTDPTFDLDPAIRRSQPTPKLVRDIG